MIGKQAPQSMLFVPNSLKWRQDTGQGKERWPLLKRKRNEGVHLLRVYLSDSQYDLFPSRERRRGPEIGETDHPFILARWNLGGIRLCRGPHKIVQEEERESDTVSLPLASLSFLSIPFSTFLEDLEGLPTWSSWVCSPVGLGGRSYLLP